ncbi:MAG: biotin--[acetyl-CoA-carboxylase] ligase [Treponema sp.]|nr:biotin--[acetyl-CoA-carboxylase] ligase [Treponema sp.]
MNEIKLSSKAQLLYHLREKQGAPVSGSILARDMGISRVAVWKAVQSLLESGYLIETNDNGYLLEPENEKDFLYPWEFGEKENLFYHYYNTGSTMDRARELAVRGIEKAVISAEKQSAGRGRYGRTWVSRQGGLFFSILEKPKLTIADYSLMSLVIQIAVVKSLTSICGKQAYLRWPNDIYINRRKIAGITTEICGEADLISWFTGGIGVNVNNKAPSAKAISCEEVLGKPISRKAVLDKILEEIEIVKKSLNANAVYTQGNRTLANEWNQMADCIGAKAAVFEPQYKNDNITNNPKNILARGIFAGIDPAGRCILKTKEKGELYFNHGSVSLAFIIT